MTYTWDAILSHVARRIGEVAETEVEVADLVTPPNPDLGDIAFGCFKLAKAQGKSPADIAQTISEALKKGDQTIASAVAAGPYVNLTLKAGEFILRVIQEVERDGASYGASDEGEMKTLLFEYANPNTHKEVHVGHLRNFILGVSLARILKRTGYNLIPISYLNDVGSNVGKTLWRLVTMAGYDVHTFQAHELTQLLLHVPQDKQTGNELGKIYTQAVAEVTAHPELQPDISFVQTKLEEHDPIWEKLWYETRRWCLDEFGAIFDELGIHIDHQYFESSLLDRSHEVVKELLARGIAKESEGAVIVDLEDQKLGIAVLRKTDGTLLYSAKDLALSELKVKDNPSLWRSLVLVDSRQSLYFKQLSAILKLMGEKVDFGFIGYELVTLPEGAMSSRKGNIITFQSLHDEILSVARAETIARHPEWPEGKVAYTSWCVAMGGLKYGILKQDPDKVIVFESKRALSFEGDTGPYIQYAATRLASILKKAQWIPSETSEVADPSLFTERAEQRLALHVALFPRAVGRASAELKPSLLAQWCFAMAQHVAAFYHEVNVLESAPEAKTQRLRLVASALSVLLLGLDLLGITVPEEM